MTNTSITSPTLRADALEKGFVSGDVHVPVLRGLSLDIYPGELTWCRARPAAAKARCCR